MANAPLNTDFLVITSPAIERRRPGKGRLLMGIGAGSFVGLPALGFLVVLVGFPSQGKPAPIIGLIFLLIMVGTFFAPLVAIAGAILSAISFPLSFRGELQADDSGLVIQRGQRETRLGKERIDGGILLPGGPGKRPKIALYLKGGDVIHAEVDDGITAYRLLDRLGIDPAKRRVAMAVASPVRQLVAGCLSLPLSIVVFTIPLGYLVSRNPAADWPVVAYAFCVLFTMLGAMRIARPTEVIIGNDGLRIRTPLRDEWIPYGFIRSVEEIGNALYIEEIRPGTNARRNRIATGPADVMLALASRIRIAMALGSNGDGDTSASWKLDPKGKSLADWKTDLRLLITSRGYRKAGVSPEVLLSVVDDPDLPPGQRLGAAVALCFAQHPEAQERIRIAADGCADEAMKRAFEEASTGEISERVLRRAVE
jgi:hypothetical protein